MFQHNTQRQKDFSDTSAVRRESEDIDYAGSPVHELIRALPVEALKRVLDRSSQSLEGKSVLLVGCGYGTDLFYLQRHYNARITTFDLSFKCVQITRRHFADVTVFVGDSETLPFVDDSFDYALVSESLHHMARPYAGIYEMLRVAGSGVCIVEPHDCAVTRAATRIGLMQEYEDAGNYVLKFNRHDINRLAQTLFIKAHCASLFATDFSIFERLPPALKKVFVPIFKAVTRLLNIVIPSQGNVFVAVISKTD